MKKRIITVFMLLMVLVSCGSLNISTIIGGPKLSKEEVFEEKLKSYKLQAKIKTNKGDINIFLYPEAAPETVANFVFLSTKNIYDGMKFHRVIPGVLLQSGDTTGDTTGTAGYYINDEFDSWVTFEYPGVIAMANTRQANTASSQFFITLNENPEYNGKYTAFGTLVSKEDLNVAKTIKKDDIIIDIEITGVNAKSFLSNFTDKIRYWEENLK